MEGSAAVRSANELGEMAAVPVRVPSPLGALAVSKESSRMAAGSDVRMKSQVSAVQSAACLQNSTTACCAEEPQRGMWGRQLS